MAIFTGFKPEGMRKIASKMGYSGSMDDFDYYLDQNPEKRRQMIVYENVAKEMARGGVVKAQQGQFIRPVEAGLPAGFFENQKTSRKAMQDYNDQMMKNIQDQSNQFNAMQKQANEQFKQYQAAQKNVPEKNMPRGSFKDFFKSIPKPKGYDTDPVKAPVLRDATKEFDLSKIDDRGFAPSLDDPRNLVNVNFLKERAQKEYNEALKRYQNYQNVLGKNFTQKQADAYDKQIKRNEIQKKINPYDVLDQQI